MAPVCSKISNELLLPLGTKYKITYKSKSIPGLIKEAMICPSPENRVFYALFEEDDVDWKLIVDNQLCWDRDVRTRITMRDDDKRHGFITEKTETSHLETLESNGRKFHFAKSSSLDGQALIAAAARNRGIDYSKAEVLMSRMQIDVEYGWTEKECKSQLIEIYIYVNSKSKNSPEYRQTFHVTRGTTIKALKQMIENRVSIPVEEQELVYQKTILEKDNCSLVDYKIGDRQGIELYVQPLNEKQVQLFINTLRKGKVITICIMLSDTVEILKRKICEREDISFNEMRLIFGGLQLENCVKLLWYNIQKECTLHIVFRLRGGAPEIREQNDWGSTDIEESDEEIENEVKPGERGVICFGEKSTQTFVPGKFTSREDILPENFIIELRMVSKYM